MGKASCLKQLENQPKWQSDTKVSRHGHQAAQRSWGRGHEPLWQCRRADADRAQEPHWAEEADRQGVQGNQSGQNPWQESLDVRDSRRPGAGPLPMRGEAAWDRGTVEWAQQPGRSPGHRSAETRPGPRTVSDVGQCAFVLCSVIQELATGGGVLCPVFSIIAKNL
jgi:hypothetical protein